MLLAVFRLLIHCYLAKPLILRYIYWMKIFQYENIHFFSLATIVFRVVWFLKWLKLVLFLFFFLLDDGQNICSVHSAFNYTKYYLFVCLFVCWFRFWFSKNERKFAYLLQKAHTSKCLFFIEFYGYYLKKIPCLFNFFSKVW